MTQTQVEQPAVQVAGVLRVIREGHAGPARLEIDGVPFPFATVDGFSVHPAKGRIPSVTVSIAAWRVELVDDIGAPATAEHKES